MATYLYRRGNVLRLLGSYQAPGSAYTVTAFDGGGIATAASFGSQATVAAGHGVAAADLVLVGTTSTNTALCSSSGATTINFTTTETIPVATKLTNLGPEPLTTPSFNYSGVNIYSYPGSSVIGGVAGTAGRSMVTCDSNGNYEYYYQSTVTEIWEVIRDSAGLVVDINIFLTGPTA